MAKNIPMSDKATLAAMLKETEAGQSTTTWATGSDGVAFKLTIAALPKKATRNNVPFHPHSVTSTVRTAAGTKGPVEVILAVEDSSVAAPLAVAVAKAFPLVSFKSSKGAENEEKAQPKEGRLVSTRFVLAASGEEVTEEGTLQAARVAAEATRMACRLVDTPPEMFNVPEFVAEAKAVAGKHASVKFEVIEGEALRDRGYGGLWGVGKAATRMPALVVLTHEPKDAEGRSVCMVGKGIVFDTGGLSLKVGGSMVGMKSDMGGAAAMLSAFDAAVTLGHKGKLQVVLCLAENAIGPLALRNDDVVTCFSGLTVEINNTDAEGRVVLADGVAHAVQELKASMVRRIGTHGFQQPRQNPSMTVNVPPEIASDRLPRRL